MYSHLPEAIKAQILRYLTTNNFTAAKQIYDQWLKQSSFEKSACVSEISE